MRAAISIKVLLLVSLAVILIHTKISTVQISAKLITAPTRCVLLVIKTLLRTRITSAQLVFPMLK